ncbi:hypothetical protein BsWGS_08533 [Bradybaena similaris]
MSLANVVLLFLLVLELDCQNLHETDLIRNDSSQPRQNVEGTVTESVDYNIFLGDYQSTVNEENDATGHRRKNNESHYNRSHTSTNSTEEGDTVHVQLAELTFELCDPTNLCRFLCKRTVESTVDTFMGGIPEIGDGGLGPMPMQFSIGESDGPSLLRRRRDNDVFATAAGGYVLVDPPDVSLTDASGVEVRSRRSAQEDDLELPESPIWQQQPEDTCTRQGNDCSCDKYCVIFGDCCVDVFEYWSGQNEFTDLFGLISGVRSRTSIEGNFTNLTQMLELNSGNETNVINNFILNFASCFYVNENTSIFIVSRCPREMVDESLRDKCEQLSPPLMPRILATLPGGSVVFKNVFCAQCHHVVGSYLKVWSPKIECDEDSQEPRSKTVASADLLQRIESGQCHARYDVNLQTYPLRYCKPGTNRTNIINDDDQCSEMDRILCRAYYFQYDNYTNPHCEKCQSSGNLSGEVTFVETCNWNHTYVDPPDNPGILVILDISGRFSQGSNGRMTYFCRDEQVFDPLTSVCKQLFCSLGQNAYRGTCVDSTDVYVPSSSQLFPDGWSGLRILSNVSFPADILTCIAVRSSFQTFFFNTEKLLNSKIQRTALPPVYLSFPYSLCDKYINQTNVTADAFIDETLYLKQEFNKDAFGKLTDMVTALLLGDLTNYTRYMSLTNMVKYTRYDVVCQDGYNVTHRKDFTVDESNGEIYALIKYMKQKFYYPLNAIGFEMTVTTASGTAEVVVTLSICEEKKLFSNAQCKVVSYWLNQTSLYGTTLKILTSNQVYERENFVIRGHEVFVCSNFASYFRIHKTALVNSTFSVVVTLISVIFLSVMLLLYCLFPQLLTLPGKLTACLATTLMITFIFSIIPLAGLQHEVICAVLAAINHLVTLAYFWWMSSIAFHMAWTFGPHSSSLIKAVKDTEAFRRYSIFVWGVSAAIVVPSVILDIIHRRDAVSSADAVQAINAEGTNYSQDKSVSASSASPEFPIYGKANCVWFQAPLWARLTFVLVPYFISFIITVIGFAVTLMGLQRSRKVSEKVGKGSSERTLCLIYIKLSTAMGFSWILSIVTGFYPDSLELQYIYIFLTLLQGVLLFLAFMANKRVYKMIRQRMQPKVIRGSQKTSSSTVNTAYTN